MRSTSDRPSAWISSADRLVVVLVGVYEEDPVGHDPMGRHGVQGGVALGGVVVERPLGHVGPGGAG